MTILTTARLRLEPIDDRHFEGLQAMNRQPDVMRFISGEPETPEQTRAMIALVRERWDAYGFSWWAFIDGGSGELVGAGCIQHLGRDPANPHEVGWRLVPGRWGQGLASEAARAMAGWAFETLGAPLLCAVRHPDNADSARVMERLGMRYRALEEWYGKPLAVHEMTRDEWLAGCGKDSRVGPTNAASPAPARHPG